MKLKRSAGGIYIPEPASHWTFKQSSGPILDKGGKCNLTVSNGTLNGTSATFGGANSTFSSPAGVYDQNPNFTCFVIFKPNAVDQDFDILAVASGTGFTPDDYTWFMAMTMSGYYFGVASDGQYGAGVNIDLGGIDTGKKYYCLFGYQANPGANRAFIYLKAEGSPDIHEAHYDNMNPFQTSRNYYFANCGYFAGGSVSVDYHRLMYWNHAYLDQVSVFQALTEQYKS